MKNLMPKYLFKNKYKKYKVLYYYEYLCRYSSI